MTFAVLLHPKAAKELEKTQSKTRARIIEHLKELREKPDKIGKPLKQSYFWSMRVGDYRVIYQINKSEVIILFIGHRSRVYDNFLKMI